MLAYVVDSTVYIVAIPYLFYPWAAVAIVVAMPIVIPLAEAVNADLSLVIGALISASAFGSHTCFYGDSTVLSAHGSGCGTIDHALTQLPYALLAAGVASVAFVIAGYALG